MTKVGAGSAPSAHLYKQRKDMATTDFESWLLSHVIPTDYTDVYDCYLAIQDKKGNYRFDVKNNVEQGKSFVTPAGTDDTLMIASEKARQTILSMIEREYCDGMDIEGYYAMHQAMEKED